VSGVSVVAQPPTKPVRSHPYEKVGGDPDSDSTYAGLKEDAGGESGGSYAPSKYDAHQELVVAPPYMSYSSSKNATSSVSVNPSHISHLGGEDITNGGVMREQLYSVVSDRSDRPVGGRRAARSKGLHLPGASTASSGDSGLLFATPHPPPVPDKRYSSGTEDNVVSPGSLHGGGATTVDQACSGSPSLPPRNSDGFAGGPPASVWSTELSSSVGRSFFGLAAASALPLQWSTADQFPLIDADVTDSSPTDMPLTCT